MKTIQLFLLFMLFAAASQAQIQFSKGSFLISTSSSFNRFSNTNFGGFYFSTFSTNDDKASNEKETLRGFGISPKVGYSITDYLVGGVELNLAADHFKSTSSDISLTSTDKLIQGGPFLRYYIPVANFVVFPEIHAGFGQLTSDGSIKSVDFNTSIEDKINLSEFGGGIGLGAPLGGRTMLDIFLGYSSISYTLDNEKTNYPLVALEFGISILLDKQKEN